MSQIFAENNPKLTVKVLAPQDAQPGLQKQESLFPLKQNFNVSQSR